MATFSGQYVSSSGVDMENCLFYSNTSGHPQGSALYFNVQQDTAAPWVVNCTVADNTNGGIQWGDGPVSPLVGNTILWDNGPYEIAPDCAGGAAVVYSDVMGEGGCDM